jgi:hypothetical protein
MKVRKTPVWDGDGLGKQACVAVNLAPLAQVVTSLERPRYTNLDIIIRREAILTG